MVKTKFSKNRSFYKLTEYGKWSVGLESLALEPFGHLAQFLCRTFLVNGHLAPCRSTENHKVERA